MSAVIITLTEQPSRSKMAGPCWAGIRRNAESRYTYATTGGVEIQAEPGDTLTVGATARLRHRTRNGYYHQELAVIVTADPADTVTIEVGSAQYIRATVSGVKEA